MSQRLGGIVCDNPKCNKFIDYVFIDKIKKCIVIPLKHKWTYCSEKCSEAGKYYRRNMEENNE